MTRAEKDKAIDRLTQPASSPKLMPPARFGDLVPARAADRRRLPETVNIATRPSSHAIVTTRMARGSATCACCTRNAIAVGTKAANSAPT